MKLTPYHELSRFPTDIPVRESLFRQIGKVTWGMLVKRENKGSGGIADVIMGVNIDSWCWYQGMKSPPLPFSQKAIPWPDGCAGWQHVAGLEGWAIWYPGTGGIYPQLLLLMQIQQGLVRLSREAVQFASVCASFRETLIPYRETWSGSEGTS